MAVKWYTLEKGIRYYEHSTDLIPDPTDRRRQRPKRNYYLQYRLDGKVVNESVGWEDQYPVEEVRALAAELEKNRREGVRPFTNSERKTINNQLFLEQQAQEEKEKRNTFGNFFREVFLPYKEGQVASGEIKKGTLQDIESRFKFWLEPALQDMTFDDEIAILSKEPTGPAIASLTFDEIEEIHFQKLATKMRVEVVKTLNRVRDYDREDAHVAAGHKFMRFYTTGQVTEPRRKIRLVQSVKAAAHEIWNYALERGYTSKEFPGKRIAKGSPRNQRTKYFTVDEATAILTALKKRSVDSYHHAMFSLYTGLRAGAILSLTWQDIEEGVARDTKNKETVHIPFLDSVESLQQVIDERKAMFPNRKRSDYLFPKKGGKPNERREQVSNAFKEVLGDLRINKDLSDERGKGVFHTLRHTFASWLVQDGEPLFKVGRLMGQKTPAMTNRYSHLAPDSFQDAAAKLNRRKIIIDTDSRPAD